MNRNQVKIIWKISISALGIISSLFSVLMFPVNDGVETYGKKMYIPFGGITYIFLLV